MIKIKILNYNKGRNEPTFRPLILLRDMLYTDYSIELTLDDDYDYLFVGMHDFIDKTKPLQESIEWGLANLSEILANDEELEVGEFELGIFTITVNKIKTYSYL